MATDSSLGKNSRLYLLGAMLLFWCLAICGRLVYLQIFRYGSFVKQAEHQQQRAIPLSAKRGVIYDRAGHELAMSVLVDSAFAVPTEVKDLPTAVSLITRITGEDRNVVLADCRNHKTFCWVARKADDETIERIKSLNLQGIHFQKEPKRFYPARDLAAQVVGTVGMEDSGQSGIEHEFDDELRGRAGKMFISVDARRQWFSDVEKQPEPGENLVLTIDKNIQYIAEKELDQAIHDTQAIAGTVIVENPHTGEILALANRPTFNPNLRKQITPAALTNRAVSDVYEPGSTFKLVTISAALEEKLTNPNEIFDCQMGSIVYNGMRIRDSRPHGLLPVWGVLAESSDVGAIKIALRLGEDRFYKYIRAYRIRPADRNRVARRDARADQAGQPLVEGFDCGDFDGPGDRNFADSAGGADFHVRQRWRVGGAAHRRGHSRAAGHAADRGFPSRSVAPRDFELHCGRDAGDDAESGARRHGPQGDSRRLLVGGENRNGAESGSRNRRVFEDEIYRVVRGIRAGEQSADRGGGDSGFCRGTAPGRAGFGAGVPPRFAAGARISARPARPAAGAAASVVAGAGSGKNKDLKEDDLEEGTPDHPGEPLETAEVDGDSLEPAKAGVERGACAPTARAEGKVVPGGDCGKREQVERSQPARQRRQTSHGSDRSCAREQTKLPATGTVVLDVEQGGIEVPSFVGKTVRGAVEAAQDAGLELEAVGSGVARQQSPPAGTHVAAGAHVTVQFER